ncbi:MAG: S1 RNA-binding domain-containing protein [Candidatus Cloacimonetes bacterium]|nr:S1 RNA-binding domain-containing protein [Candidatus Cloacimonadota bacterium]
MEKKDNINIQDEELKSNENIEEKEVDNDLVEENTETADLDTEISLNELDITETTEEVDNPEEIEGDFEQMLEESLVNLQNLEVGDKVEGEIINITDSYIFVTLGGKRDAYAEKSDYLEKDGSMKCKIGDKISGYIVKYTDTETLISKSLVAVNKRILQEAFDEKIPVSGKVKSMIKGGYLLDISGVRAFCPLTHIDNKKVGDTKQYLGQNYDFVIIEFKENGKNIVASRRVILDEEKNKLKKETLEKLKVGDIVKGKVIRLTNFGAFVDLGGIEGLIHISRLSWVRVESPSEILNYGDMVESQIISIKGDKVSLSIKDTQPDPFIAASKELKEGENVSCRVLRNQPFGSFVEIRPGVEGLIPISELALGRRINNPSEVVAEGDFIEAQIMRIKLDQKKISLSLKALQPDPWDDIEEFITENDVINGKIENVVNFGAFVKIKDGVDGLLPSSKMKLADLNYDKSNIGDEIKVRVVNIDREKKRISLEPSHLPESVVEGKDDWRKYKKQKSKKETFADDSPFSAL